MFLYLSRSVFCMRGDAALSMEWKYYVSSFCSCLDVYLFLFVSVSVSALAHHVRRAPPLHAARCSIIRGMLETETALSVEFFCFCLYMFSYLFRSVFVSVSVQSAQNTYNNRLMSGKQQKRSTNTQLLR